MSAPNAPDGGLCREIIYSDRGGVKLSGDLYLPTGPGPFPILIGVPGGGWRVCVRPALRQWGLYLAAQGYGFFAIDYRLATASRKAFPEAAQDVAAAIRFIRGSASEFSVDPDRIGLLGASAGAHLAALTALGRDAPFFGMEQQHGADISVKALVVVSGIYDLFQHWQDDLGRNPASDSNISRNLIGKDPFEDQQSFFEASPMRHISYDRNAMPVLISWGTADEVVDPGQSERFVRALQQARFGVRICRMEGGSHFWFADRLDDARSDSAKFAPQLVSFLNLNL